MKTTNRRNLFVLAFALLVVMLGFTMVVPVFPFYVGRVGAGGRLFKNPRWLKALSGTVSLTPVNPFDTEWR